MIDFLKNIKARVIFNFTAIIILIGVYILYSLFITTRNNVIQTNEKSHIDYISNLTKNIETHLKQNIKKDFYKTLSNDTNLRLELEKKLQLFITNRYRYIYLVDKETPSSTEFRFLLDGAKNINDKSDFGEFYIPLDENNWNKVCDNKEARFFKHSDIESVWMTYLRPIVIDGKVEALIVIDFSLEEHTKIVNALSNLDKTLEVAIMLLVVIFFIVIGFSYIDKLRENEKEILYKRLEETNSKLKLKTKELNEKSKRVSELNKTLENRVEEEVSKNRLKDRQMIQQSRLAQMGEMISMIAHQWRQPLAAISSSSGAISIKARLKKLDNDTVLELSNKISDYSQHLSSTIDDFREFFKSNKEQKETNFEELISSVFNIIENSINNKNIKLEKEIESNIKFTTYPNEVKQVLLNLIKNAEDALLEKKVENPSIKVVTYAKNDDIFFEITDNAGGIPNEIIDKIFDPYFSTKKQKDGTGLGLYMSKTIVEEHCKGEIIVSNENDGAKFTIILKNTTN
jgi:signal transduction histidine kinase